MPEKRACAASGCRHRFVPTSPAQKYCKDDRCKKTRAKKRKRRERTGGSSVVPITSAPSLSNDPPPPPTGRGPVETVAEAELEAAGQLSTTLGQTALALARQLDTGIDDTGSSKASVANRLHALMTEALKDAAPIDNPLSLLRRRHLDRAARG